MTNFNTLNLHENLLKGLEKMGFDAPTEIQQEMIPAAIEGKDVMASAATGSGKTAAFLLPTFHKFLSNPDESKAKRKKRGPRVLILTPTRELAEQVMKVATDIRVFTDISVKSVVGGVPIMKHKRMLREVVDVLVATPGRLIDLMKQGDVHLQDVDTFILDEADRMLDMGFSEDVLKISKAVKAERQTLLVSATLEGRNLEKIIKQVMSEPVTIELTSATDKHEHITQVIYRASDMVHKIKMIKELSKNSDIWQAVIFTATKSMTEKLALELSSMGEKVDILNGDMRQSARKVSIKRMQSGQIRFLVATDVAARGLDIKELTHVINFDLPRQPEDYIHRIGRVGRAGKEGEAISLVANDQWPVMKDIQHMMDMRPEERVIEGLEWRPSKASEKRKAKAKVAKKQEKRNVKKSSASKAKIKPAGSAASKTENAKPSNGKSTKKRFATGGKPNGKPGKNVRFKKADGAKAKRSTKGAKSSGKPAKVKSLVGRIGGARA